MVTPATPGKVLIVETHAGYRRTLVDLLGDMGVREVLDATSPNEVLTALVAEPELLGALISHDLPDAAAQQAARALWILAPGTPVIFYTGHSDAVIDADDFPAPVALLCKPLRTWDLKATLGKLQKQAQTPKRGSTFPLE